MNTFRDTTEFRAFVEAGEALRDFYERSNRVVDRLLTAEGASYARIRLMSYIDRHTSVRSVDLMQAFGFAPRTITDAVDALERDGLAMRTPDASDRRVKNITLTDSGLTLLRTVEPVLGQFGYDLFNTLDLKERQQLASLMQKLNARLDSLEDIKR